MNPSSSRSKGGSPQSSSTANRSQVTGSWAGLMRSGTSEFQTRNRVLQSPSVTSYDSQAAGSWAPSSWSGTSEFQTRNCVSQSPSAISRVSASSSAFAAQQAGMTTSSRVSTADGFRERRCVTRSGAEESEERSRVLRSSTAQGNDMMGEEEMKELRKIAELHSLAASPRIPRLADEFFDSMNRDRNGKVKIEDFQSLVLQKGYKQLQNPRLFDDLEVGRTRTLDFSEMMTLYYIIKSGRPNCDRREVFIPGVFFTCVRCFKKGLSFNLCSKCYEEVDSTYDVHNSGTQFLDNYTLMQTVRESSSLPRCQYHDRHDHDTDDQRWDDEPSSPTPIVPEAPKQNSRIDLMDLAYKLLELAIAICNAFAARPAT